MFAQAIWQVALSVFLLGRPALGQKCNLATHDLVGTPPACLPTFLQPGTKVLGALRQNLVNQRYRVAEYYGVTALSKSGQTMVASSYIYRTPFLDNVQAVIFTFKRVKASWTQDGPALVLSEPNGFGSSNVAALSDDGLTLAVGGLTSSKAVRLFRRSGSTWVQTAALTRPASPAPFNTFGGSLALSADGKWLVLSAPAGPGDVTGFEGAFVYSYNGVTWKKASPKLFDPKLATGQQGWAVAISGDGRTVAVGAPSAQAALIYRRNAQGAYKKQAVLQGSDPNFGWSLALSGSGTTLAVGARGAVSRFYVFKRKGTAWSGGPVRPKPPTTGESFGSSVSISSDGKVVAVAWKGNKAFAGGAYVFVANGGRWLQLGSRINNTAGRIAELGGGVRLSGDGLTLVMTGMQNNTKLTSSGAALVFRRARV